MSIARRKSWRRTGLACLFGLIAIGLIAAYLVACPDRVPAHPPSTAGALRVASANLSWDNASPERAAQALTALDADLLILVEWTGTNLGSGVQGDFRRLLDEPRPGTHGVLVLIRDDLDASASLVPNPLEGPCRIPFATARILRGADTLTVLGIHAPPPVRACRGRTEPTLDFLAGLIRNGRLRTDFGAGRAGDPVVMAGDFNALPWSPGLKRILAAGLRDGYEGLAGTWSPIGWLPVLLRIDRVLTGGDMTVRGSWVADLPGSDHRAVAADIVWP